MRGSSMGVTNLQRRSRHAVCTASSNCRPGSQTALRLPYCARRVFQWGVHHKLQYNRQWISFAAPRARALVVSVFCSFNHVLVL